MGKSKESRLPSTMNVIKYPHSEEIKQDGKYVLFVEGSEAEGSKKGSIDAFILRELLKSTPITIKSLGSSQDVKSVAKALYEEQEFYYFLIDRDHSTENDVNECWENFPNPENNNLLIWKLREIENYFLDPVYLAKSKYLSVKISKLKSCIVETCQSYLFLDIANQVIIQTRESLKETWMEAFDKTNGFKDFDRTKDFKTKDSALEKLLEREEFQEHEEKCVENLKNPHIEELFEEIFNKMTGGKSKLEMGSGKWLDLIRGKKVLPTIINECFKKVKDLEGKPVQGPKRVKEVLKNLAGLDITKQPPDFQELHKLISEKIYKKILVN